MNNKTRDEITENAIHALLPLLDLMPDGSDMGLIEVDVKTGGDTVPMSVIVGVGEDVRAFMRRVREAVSSG